MSGKDILHLNEFQHRKLNFQVNNGGCSIAPRVNCINTRGSFRYEFLHKFSIYFVKKTFLIFAAATTALLDGKAMARHAQRHQALCDQ